MSSSHKEKKSHKSKDKSKAKEKETKKSSAGDKPSTAASSDSMFVRVSLNCTVAISPYYASGERLFKGIVSTLSQLLMTWVPQLNGIPVAFKKVVVLENLLRMNPESGSAYLRAPISVQVLLFRPRVHSFVQAHVRNLANDHIQFLVEGIFPIVVAEADLGAHVVNVVQDGAAGPQLNTKSWRDAVTQEIVAVGDVYRIFVTQASPVVGSIELRGNMTEAGAGFLRRTKRVAKPEFQLKDAASFGPSPLAAAATKRPFGSFSTKIAATPAHTSKRIYLDDSPPTSTATAAAAAADDNEPATAHSFFDDVVGDSGSDDDNNDDDNSDDNDIDARRNGDGDGAQTPADSSESFFSQQAREAVLSSALSLSSVSQVLSYKTKKSSSGEKKKKKKEKKDKKDKKDRSSGKKRSTSAANLGVTQTGDDDESGGDDGRSKKRRV
jgi:hypothetical protein